MSLTELLLDTRFEVARKTNGRQAPPVIMRTSSNWDEEAVEVSFVLNPSHILLTCWCCMVLNRVRLRGRQPAQPAYVQPPCRSADQLKIRLAVDYTIQESAPKRREEKFND